MKEKATGRCINVTLLFIMKTETYPESMLATQLCPTLWDPNDDSLPGFSACRILQTRILEWTANFLL